MDNERQVNFRAKGSMHTELQMAAVERGVSQNDILNSALERELRGAPTKAADSVMDICRALLGGQHVKQAGQFIRDNTLRKAAVTAVDWGDLWTSASGQALADEFLASLAPISILDAVAKYAATVPRIKVAYIASGASADLHSEGMPIATSKIKLAADTLVERTPVAIVVLNDDLMVGGQAVMTLVENEVRRTIADATNAAFLAAINPGTATAGTNAIESLYAGLDALTDSNRIVVAADYDTARELRTDASIDLAAGNIEVVPVSGLTAMYVLAADRIVLDPGALNIATSQEASLQMDDAPQNTAGKLVSLWQQNMTGLKVGRHFRVRPDSNAAVKVA